MGKLRIMGREGDRVKEWAPDEAEAVREAERIFQEAQAKGHTAIAVQGERSEVIKEFDPQAEQIVMVPRIAGG